MEGPDPDRHEDRVGLADVVRIPFLTGARASGADRYLDALRLGDLGGAWRVVEDAAAEGCRSAEIHERIVAPAMVDIGELWARKALGVADEHLATAITVRVLERLQIEATVDDMPRSERVVLAAIEGEHHVVGLRMAADLLELAGFSTEFLGADVPSSALTDFVYERRPAVVCLTTSGVADAAGLTATVEALEHAHPSVVILVGGVGCEAVAGRLDGAALLCARAGDVVGSVEHLLAKTAA